MQMTPMRYLELGTILGGVTTALVVYVVGWACYTIGVRVGRRTAAAADMMARANHTFEQASLALSNEDTTVTPREDLWKRRPAPGVRRSAAKSVR